MKIAVSILFIVIVLWWAEPILLYASQSTITESEGYACMGEDKSRKQTEAVSMADAKRRAMESVSTYIKSETHVKDFELEKDLVSAYANAAVKIIQEIKTKVKEIGEKTRGVVITEKSGDKKTPSEFSETTVDVKTGEK